MIEEVYSANRTEAFMNFNFKEEKTTKGVRCFCDSCSKNKKSHQRLTKQTRAGLIKWAKLA
jgi:hypothetical protein